MVKFYDHETTANAREGNLSCWLRDAVDPAHCERESGYELYSLGIDSTPTPASTTATITPLSAPAPARQHGQIARLCSAPARPLCLPGASLVAQGSVVLSERGPSH